MLLSCLGLQIKWAIFISIFLQVLLNSDGTIEPTIDETYFASNPDCGNLIPCAKARISNALPSSVRYPWAILVVRKTGLIEIEGVVVSYCGGSIITNKAITAGHCICGEKEGAKCRKSLFPGVKKNQITVENKIEVHIQDCDWELQLLAHISKAYVKYDENKNSYSRKCSQPEKHPECYQSPPRKKDYHDIGILYLEEGQTFQDLQDTFRISGPIIPLCLPSKDAKILEDKEITTVGYGLQYEEWPRDENWNEQNRDPIYTSCATNKYGVYWDTTSKKSKFKPCSVQFMKENGWGCIKSRVSDMLPISYEFDVCEKYWNIAREFISQQHNDIQSEFQEALKIKVNSICKNWIPECLSLDLFESRGWCEVKGGNFDDWSICDVSCDHAPDYYTLEGDNLALNTSHRYNIMTWILDDVSQTHCRGSRYAIENFQPDYIVCVKSLLKPAKVWIFNENENMEFDRFEIETENIYDEHIGLFEEAENSGYQLQCRGDSGSGHWIQREAGDMKHVLVGIFTRTFACGWGAKIEKINNKGNIKWIKSHLKLN